jgi:chemotaxis protein methyltransferase CheR
MEDELSEADFRRFAGLVYASCGIHLSDQKRELLRARLRKRLRALGMTSFKDYFALVSSQGPDGELKDLLDVVSTNKTEFLREAAHFQHLREVAVPAWIAGGGPARGPLRVWSAACSSGEEVYTLAMALTEALEGRGDFRILGTDISTRVLDKAMSAVYEERLIAPLPAAWREAYLRPCGWDERRDCELWTVDPALRAKTSFGRLNLIDGELPFRQPLDMVFCRNVMIYFDKATQEGLVSRMAAALRPGAWLYTGLSESLLAIKHSLQTMGPSVYRRPG